MYTPEDSPFEKFRTEKLKGVAMSPDVLELVAKAYEGGFIDGMQKQMQSSVDRAVNRMAEQPAQQQEPVAVAAWNLARMTRLLFDAWCKAEPTHNITKYPESYMASFQDMARAVIYTSPPASKPWVGLTRDERMDIINRFAGQDWVYAVEAIETKLREKNA